MSRGFECGLKCWVAALAGFLTYAVLSVSIEAVLAVGVAGMVYLNTEVLAV